jgi:glucosylceramidase
VKPGARRIACAPSRSPLLATAVRNPDASVAVVVMNASDEKADYSLWVNGNAAQVSSPPHSLQTLVVCTRVRVGDRPVRAPSARTCRRPRR